MRPTRYDRQICLITLMVWLLEVLIFAKQHGRHHQNKCNTHNILCDHTAFLKPEDEQALHTTVTELDAMLPECWHSNTSEESKPPVSVLVIPTQVNPIYVSKHFQSGSHDVASWIVGSCLRNISIVISLRRGMLCSIDEATVIGIEQATSAKPWTPGQDVSRQVMMTFIMDAVKYLYNAANANSKSSDVAKLFSNRSCWLAKGIIKMNIKELPSQNGNSAEAISHINRDYTSISSTDVISRLASTNNANSAETAGNQKEITASVVQSSLPTLSKTITNEVQVSQELNTTGPPLKEIFEPEINNDQLNNETSSKDDTDTDLISPVTGNENTEDNFEINNNGSISAGKTSANESSNGNIPSSNPPGNLSHPWSNYTSTPGNGVFNSTNQSNHSAEETMLTRHHGHGGLTIPLSIIGSCFGSGAIVCILCYRRIRNFICNCCSICRDAEDLRGLLSDTDT